MKEYEMLAAFKWGMESIQVFKDRGEKVPELLYERTLEVGAELIKALEVECGG